MTTHSSATYASTNENAVVADLASRAVTPEQFEIVEDRLVGVVVDGTLHTFNLDDYADNPRRATGRVKLTDPDSFVEYVNRHSSPASTTIWSAVDLGTFCAVFEDHARKSDTGLGEPGYGDHRATLQLANSPDWDLWLMLNGQFVSQQVFAEHIEDGASCIASPEPAAMLELAQSFHANTTVAFESGDRLQSGEVKLTYRETVEARAGHSGTIEVPAMIDLQLQVFEGGAIYALKARFMYRINNGHLSLGYRLIRPDVARKAAFDDMTANITDGIGLPVMAGVPRN